jgi:hypothetical protein
MIVWLASFPRSGNTLLRTVLKQTMGLGSYSDELVRPIVGLTDAAKREFGHIPLEEPWEEFYARASRDPDLVLVKTHQRPIDAQPAIYVVRDGRAALSSYRSYHEKFLGDQRLGLLALVMGADYYGGWSDHYEAWSAEGRRTMTLRFEELTAATPELLRKIAGFLGHQGAVAPWANPFERLHGENPDFFRVGSASWQRPPDWTDLVDAAFYRLHGQLMEALGYADAATVSRALERAPSEWLELVRISRALRDDKRMFERVAGERLAVIKGLDAEVKRLNEACRQRLEAITVLDAEVKRLAGLKGVA